ncbi:MAG: hypothetical protein Q4D81_11950, partial [Eubacteriales bacterium]|nr:hypothetical protein [Eubacteriales bacterium]
MKKFIRLLIIIFCAFFILSAMPGSFFPVFRSFRKQAAEFFGNATLLLAEKIDTFLDDTHPDEMVSQGEGTEGEGSSGQETPEDGELSAQAGDAGEDDAQAGDA